MTAATGLAGGLRVARRVRFLFGIGEAGMLPGLRARLRALAPAASAGVHSVSRS